MAIETLNEGRIGIGAQMVGLAAGALEACRGYSYRRYPTFRECGTDRQGYAQCHKEYLRRLWAPVSYPRVLESERGVDETGIILPAKSRFLLTVVAKAPPNPRGTMGVFGRLEPAPPMEPEPQLK